MSDEAALKGLARDFARACIDVFGHPVKVYASYYAHTGMWEFTVYARSFGKNSRYDLEIAPEKVGAENDLELLMAQLPDQIMHWFDKNAGVDSFGKPWFSLDRQTNDTGYKSVLCLGQEELDLD